MSTEMYVEDLDDGSLASVMLLQDGDENNNNQNIIDNDNNIDVNANCNNTTEYNR